MSKIGRSIVRQKKDTKRVDGYGSESLGGGRESDGRELFKIAK